MASSPAVVDGTLYFGSNDHHVYAVDAATGTHRWKYKTGSRVPSSPAIADGLVLINSYDSHFYALDARTGEPRWKFKTGGERRFAGTHLNGAEPAAESMPDPFDMYLSSPAVVHGVAYFGSGDGHVYALKAESGELQWKFKTGNVVHASPAVADGTVYIGSWDSWFYALDAATGREKWRFKTGEDPKIHNQVGIQSSAVVADGIVYFGCRDSKLYAVDARTGQERWSFSNKGSWVINSPAVHEGVVYFATSDSGLFHALNARTGAPVYSIAMNRWPMFSSPAIAGRRLYMGTHEGKLVAIDLDVRKLAWSFQTEASRRNGPAYTKDDGTPDYQAAYPGTFYDDMVVGLARMMSVGAVLSSPAVAGNSVYFGSMDGNVYALE